MTRYADAYIMALFPRSSYRAADDPESNGVTAGVSPDLWVSVAVYKLVCAVDGLIECVVNSLRTTVREPSSEPTTRQGKSSIDIDHPQKILSALRFSAPSLYGNQGREGVCNPPANDWRPYGVGIVVGLSPRCEDGLMTIYPQSKKTGRRSP